MPAILAEGVFEESHETSRPVMSGQALPGGGRSMLRPCGCSAQAKAQKDAHSRWSEAWNSPELGFEIAGSLARRSAERE